MLGGCVEGQPDHPAACDNRLLREAVQEAFKKNIPVAVSAGNDRTDACRISPGNDPKAFTVAATDMFDNMARDSNYGKCVNIFAPGVDILSAWTNHGVSMLSGSSMAVCPSVPNFSQHKNYTMKSPTCQPRVSSKMSKGVLLIVCYTCHINKEQGGDITNHNEPFLRR